MASGGRSRTAKRNIVVVDDMARALDLRREGASYRAIAAALSCSLGRAHELVAAAIKAVPVEAVEHLRAVEGERLDADYARLGQVIVEAMALSSSAAREVVIKATHERTNISAYRAKLFGLNAKEQIDLSGSVALTHDAHDQLLDRLARLAVAAGAGEGGPEPIAGGGAGASALLEGVGEAGTGRTEG